MIDFQLLRSGRGHWTARALSVLWVATSLAAAAPPSITPNTFLIDYVGKTSARVTLNVTATTTNDVTLATAITPYSNAAFNLTGAKINQLNRTTILEIEPGTANRERVFVGNLVYGHADQVARGYNRTDPGKSHPAGAVVRAVAHEMRVCYRKPGEAWDDQRSFPNWSNGGNYPTEFIGSYVTGLDAGSTYQLRVRIRPRRNNLQVLQVSIANKVATVTLAAAHGITVGMRPYLGSLSGAGIGDLVNVHQVSAVPTPATYQFSTQMGDQVLNNPELFTQVDDYQDCTGDARQNPDLLEFETYPDGPLAGQPLQIATTPAADVQPALPARRVDTAMPSAYANSFTVPAGNCGDGSRGLQALLDQIAAQTGSADRNYHIVVPHGTVCQGYFSLRRKKDANGAPETGTGTGWVVIEPDTDASLLPPPGVRTAKSYADAGLLARLQNTFVGDQGVTLTADDYATGYRLNNLDLGSDINQDPLAVNQYNTVVFTRGSDDASREGDRLPRRIVLDRCLIGGSWYNTHGTRSAVRMRGSYQGIINSVLHNCNNYPGMDTGCIQISDGQGPFLIENNEIAGGSETIFIDDQASVTQRNGQATDEFIPRDITIRRNHVYKPMEYFRKSDVYGNQSYLPVASANLVAGGAVLTTAVPHDVGDPRNGPTRVTIAGGAGKASVLNGYWPAQRIDARTIQLTVAVSDAVDFGSSLTLRAGITGAAGQTVTWSVLNNVGAISPAGVYTAPATATAEPQAALIQAVSSADSSVKGFSLVQIGSSGLTLQSSNAPLLYAGQTFQFALAKPQAVDWSISPAVGSIDGNGLYTAPASGARQPITVKVVSRSNPRDVAYGLVVIDASQPFIPIRMFMGSGPDKLVDVFGQTWAREQGASAGYNEGPFDLNYQNTVTPELYRSYHQANDFTYSFAVPNGAYTVIIKGQEPFTAGVGDRVFSISINGTEVEPSLDRYARNGLRFVQDLSYPVTVTGGQIQVRLISKSINMALINALEILAGPEPARLYVQPIVAPSPLDISGQALTVSYARAFQEKNLLELKKGRQVLVEGNLFEGAWGAADGTSSPQGGHAVVITPRGANGGGGQFPSLAVACLESLCNGDVQDLTFRNNIVRNAGGGIIFGGFDYAAPSGGMKRARVESNLFYNIDAQKWNENGPGTGTIFTAQNGVESITAQHNTFLVDNNGAFGYGAGFNADIFFDSNIIPFGQAGMSSEANGRRVVGWPNRPACDAGDWPCAKPVHGMLQGGGDLRGSKGSFTRNALYPNFYFTPQDSGGFSWLRSYWGYNFYGDEKLLSDQYWITRQMQDAAGGLCAAIGFEDCEHGNFRLKPNSPFRAGAPTRGSWQNGNSGPGADGNAVGLTSQDELEIALGKVTAVAPEVGSDQAVFRFSAPDGVGCPVDVSTDPVFGTVARLADDGGARTRELTVVGLLPGTTYYWRVLCAAEQPSGAFTTAGTGGTASTVRVSLGAVPGVNAVSIEYGQTQSFGQRTANFVCTNQCVLDLPTGGGSVLYYRPLYLNANGQTVRTGTMQVFRRR